MKTKLLMAAAVAAVLGLASCASEDAKLAGELAGTWKGTTTEVIKGKKDKADKPDKADRSDKDGKHKEGDRDRAGRPDCCDMTCTPTLTFDRTSGTNGGALTISADYTLTRGVETTATATATPVKATVNGTVNASGTWTVKDGDEVLVTLDPTKTVVDIDTTSLVLSYAGLTDAPQDSLATVKERVASNITDVIKPMIAGKVQKMHKFDDVKVIGNTLTLDAGHNKLTLTKQ